MNRCATSDGGDERMRLVRDVYVDGATATYQVGAVDGQNGDADGCDAVKVVSCAAVRAMAVVWTQSHLMVRMPLRGGIVCDVAARWLVASAFGGLASAGCNRCSSGLNRVHRANAGVAIAAGDAVRILPVVGGDDEGVGGVVVADDGGGGTDELVEQNLWWLWL